MLYIYTYLYTRLVSTAAAPVFFLSTRLDDGGVGFSRARRIIYVTGLEFVLFIIITRIVVRFVKNERVPKLDVERA